MWEGGKGVSQAPTRWKTNAPLPPLHNHAQSTARGFTGVYSAFGPQAPPPCVHWCKFSQKWCKFPSQKCKFKKWPVSLNTSTNVQNS